MFWRETTRKAMSASEEAQVGADAPEIVRLLLFKSNIEFGSSFHLASPLISILILHLVPFFVFLPLFACSIPCLCARVMLLGCMSFDLGTTRRSLDWNSPNSSPFTSSLKPTGCKSKLAKKEKQSCSRCRRHPSKYQVRADFGGRLFTGALNSSALTRPIRNGRNVVQVT